MRGKVQEQKCLKDNCITKPSPNKASSSQSWEPAGRSTCWRLSFSGASVGLNLFQAAQLVSVSSKKLSGRSINQSFSTSIFRESSSQLCFTSSGQDSQFSLTTSREGLSESGEFQGFSEVILSCLPFCLRSFPAG